MSPARRVRALFCVLTHISLFIFSLCLIHQTEMSLQEESGHYLGGLEAGEKKIKRR